MLDVDYQNQDIDHWTAKWSSVKLQCHVNIYCS